MTDVIVVGAGPSGSTAAAILARAGCRVLVLDRARFPRPKPCGDYLNPGCGSVLSRIGAWEAVAASSAPVAGMRLVAADGTRAPATFSAGRGCALPRAALDHLLVMHAAAAGASVVEDAAVVGVDREARRVRVTVDRGRGRVRTERHQASVVIGADGLGSRVARAIGAGTPLRQGRFAVGGYLEGLAPDNGDGDRRPYGELHLARDRYCGVAYFPDGRANVTIALSRRELRTWWGALEPRYWATLRTFPGLRDRVTSATLVGGLRATGPLAFCRRRAVSRGVLLAGDAAGFLDPMTGQGIYLALRGGELAADAVARALGGSGATPRNLAGYERARRRAFAGAFLLSRVLQRIAFQPALANHALRRMAGRPDLGTRFIDALGNVRPAASVLHPGFLAGLFG
jgi:menaquinone-9 beta-reductase